MAKDTVYNYDIIIIGQQPWDTDIGSNCKDIALELSKTNRVLYVNSPLDRVTIIRNKRDPKIAKRINVIKRREDGLLKILDNLWNYYPDCKVESINWIKSQFIFNHLNHRNNRIFSKSISKAINILDFKKFILINDSEIFKGFYLQDFLKPILSVYYSRDYMLGVDYWKRHGLKLEPLLIEKSDICFANSKYLMDHCLQYNKNSYNVGQGCDVQNFTATSIEVPKDIADLKSLRIGYVGALNSERLDISIIECIAVNFPAMHVLLVGQEDDVFKTSTLHDLPNVIFLGRKSVDELPAYINAFDVCINPQLVNPITIGNYPRKIDEYLALGKPVIATATEAMQDFKDYIYIAKTPEDYLRLIMSALNENDSELKNNRIKFAFTHTWGNSVNLMLNKIGEFLKAQDETKIDL